MIGTAVDIALLEQKYPMFLNLCVVEKKLGKWLDFLPAFKEMTLKEFPPHCQRFETCDIISHCIKDLLNGDFYKAKKRLDRLIKKFEVFRRIQSAYDHNYRKIGNHFHDKGLYAYFSLALLLAYFRAKSFKSLNTVLKVNDMLTTSSFQNDQPATIVLTCAVLELEQDIVLNLSKEHGLNP